MITDDYCYCYYYHDDPHHPDLSTTITLDQRFMLEFFASQRGYVYEDIHHQSAGSPRMGCYADREYARDRGDGHRMHLLGGNH